MIWGVGRLGLHVVSRCVGQHVVVVVARLGASSVDIDNEEDFLIAENILLGKERKFNFKYHQNVETLIKDGKIKPN